MLHTLILTEKPDIFLFLFFFRVLDLLFLLFSFQCPYLGFRFLGYRTIYTIPYVYSSLSDLACFLGSWWAQVDSNHRPCAYQAHALTT